MALTVLPIPSRFGTRVEFKESVEWLERIADILKDCYADWLPKWIEPKFILEQIKIPQIDYFSFGEKLAVVEQGTNDPEGMGFIFSKIATLIATELSDVESFVGSEYYQTRKNEYGERNPANKKQTEDEYLYDVYISYPRELYPWVRELLIPTLVEYLHDELDRTPDLYLDINDPNSNEMVSLASENAFQRSRTYIIVMTGAGKNNAMLNTEVSSVLKRETATGKKLLFPLYYGPPTSKPPSVTVWSRHMPDLSGFGQDDISKSSRVRTQFYQEVEKLAFALGVSIKQEDKVKKSRPVKTLKKATDENKNELLQLAKEYEEIRKKMPASNRRTKTMTNVLTRMKGLIEEPISGLSVLMNSKSPGERLVAIASLQKFPNPDHLVWLSQRVGAAEKPFIGYQASVALYLASRSFGQDNKQQMEDTLKVAASKISKQRYKDLNQEAVINAALNELNIK